jgi:autotransporter-associated beta strand protein
MCVGLCAALSAFGGGAFSTSEPLGSGNLDAIIGLSTNKTYTHAYNMNGGSGTVTINNVVFTNTAVANYAGVSNSFSLSGWSQNTTGGSTIGAGSGLNTLLNSFIYNGNPSILTLTNLVAGESYILTVYNKSWGAVGRIQTLTSSSGATGMFDENMGGEPNANLLRYTFTATNDMEWVKFGMWASGTLHLYGFSTEQVFNNAWNSGSAWSSSTWTPTGVPNSVGANADLPEQGSPSSIDIDVPVTIGHLRLDGTNGWTVAGANTLTLQADVGGVSILCTPSGSHTISNAITWSNGVLKTGAGTLTLAGTVSGSAPLMIDAGTLEITASNTLPVSTSIAIATNAVMKLSNASTQTVTALTFDGTLQRRGTWGAPGSGAQYVSDRFAGTGILLVFIVPAVGTFTVSGNLGSGNLDASPAIGLDTNLTYFSAVNVYGGALTINGVPFAGSAGANPYGPSFTTSNFGSALNSPQSVVTGQLGTMLNDFNYGNGTSAQSLTLRNLIAGRSYTLTFYNRVWTANDNRTQIITTTSGATTTFNGDSGTKDTASLLRYAFIASGPTETITMNPERSGYGFHFYGFSVSMGALPPMTDVTRRDSGSKVIADNPFSDVRMIEGTGTPGAITLAKAATTINSLTQSATNDMTTVDLQNRILTLNNIMAESGSGSLAISNGLLKCTGTGLFIDTASSNAVMIDAMIGNGVGTSALYKSGTGTLTLSGANIYNGDTAVYGGTLRIAGGSISGNLLAYAGATLRLTGGSTGGGTLGIDGATFQMDGGTASPAIWSYYRNNTVNQTAGTINYNTYFTLLNTVLNLTGGTSGCTEEALMGIDGGTNVTINIGGTHVADWLVARFHSGSGTINLNSGGILRVDEMSNVSANGVIRFDGGTLAVSTRQPTRTPTDWIKAGNSVVIANNGAVIDTAAGSVTINRPLLRDAASTGGLTKTGANTLTLTALGTYAGGTLVQGGILKVSPTTVTPTVVNAGFELPAYGATGWGYLANDGLTGGWVFTKRDGAGNGGIARNGAPWVTTAPQGSQAGFVQKNGDMSQSLSIPASGFYRLTFKAANRPAYGADALEVKIDGVSKGSWTTTMIDGNGGFKSYSVDLGELQIGAHELRFLGTAPDNGDRATAIDDVQIVWLGEPLVGSLPIGTQVTLQSGASLDLNGAKQTLAGLSGGGEVINSSTTNGTLTISSGSQATNLFWGTLKGDVSLVKAGSGTQVLAGSNTYSGVTLITGGVLQLPLAGATVSVANASFETHNPLAAGVWGYNPSGATWIFTAASGISQANDVWIAPTAGIEPTKAGFIQMNGTITGSNTVANAGWYTISFLAGKRPRYTATQLSVEVDGVTQFQFAPGVFTDAGGTFSGNAFLSKGPHELRFRGYATGDTATWIDRIAITAMAGSLPTGTVVTVATGATLDLNGQAQTLGGVNGNGVVSNGTLAVSGTIAPGGTNNIGTLTLVTTTTLSGTLLIDVASDGSSDLLNVQGNLNVSNLDLQIQNLGLLGSGKQYLIAQCTPGGLTGRFRSDNLGILKAVQYNNATGEIRLVGRGTMISFR